MKSITPVVSVILLIMLTIVASTGAYFFINSEVGELQDSGAIEGSPYADNSRLNLVSITGSQALVRNDGTSPVTEMIVLINGEALNYTLDSPIQPGEIRAINYTSQLAGLDLEIKVIYNKGKIEEDTSPARANTIYSGFNSSNQNVAEADFNFQSCSAQGFYWINNVSTGILDFADDEIGELPSILHSDEDPGATIKVISEYNGKSKVVELFDNNLTLGEYSYISYQFNETNSSSISFYLSMNDSDNNFGLIDFWNTHNDYPILLAYGTLSLGGVNADSQIVCAENGASSMKLVSNISQSEWYKIRISFNNSLNYYNVSINDGQEISCSLYEPWGGYEADTFYILTGADSAGLPSGSLTHYTYIDDINISELSKTNVSSFNCCGDDLGFDDFYNSTNYCCNGLFDSSSCFCGDGICQSWENVSTCDFDCQLGPDEDFTACLNNDLSNIWFSGTVTGNNEYCCGDDREDDDFYNGTLSDTENICFNGVYYRGIDKSSVLCNNYGYLWLNNANGVTMLTTLIDTHGIQLFDTIVSDLNNDGNMDIIVVDVSTIYWYENDGSESFTKHTLGSAPANARSLYAYDFDNDNDMDIVSFGVNGIKWHKNDGTGSFTTITIASFSPIVSSNQEVHADDLDDDGDGDFVTAEYNSGIIWYENNGTGNFTSHLVYLLSKAKDVFVIDLDIDGDKDIIAVSSDGSTVVWFENDGSETFTYHLISTSLSSLTSVYASDLNNDGNIDVIAAGTYEIAWFMNDGSETFTQNTIGGCYEAYDLLTTDFDNDGDNDILMATNQISWYENNGTGGFINHLIDNTGVYDIALADFNGDSITDLASGGTTTKNVKLYLASFNNGSCCGDEGANDNFSNSTHQCVNGVLSAI